jgi:hypothetical protein
MKLYSFDRHGCKGYRCFWDSLLVVQHFKGEFPCLDGSLNSYLDRCLKTVKSLDTFTILKYLEMKVLELIILPSKYPVTMLAKEKKIILQRPMLAVIYRK